MAERFAESVNRSVALPHASEPYRIRRTRELVETRWADKFTAHQAAVETKVSSQYFGRAFKRDAGRTASA